MLATEERVKDLTDTVERIDLEDAIAVLETREFSSNAFARYLINKFSFTVEYAKRVIYALVENGRLILTDRYTLRVAE
jgi:hypothetical protein